MRFADVKGNEGLKKSLVHMMNSGRLSHAILFVEENGGGAFPLAIALAQAVNCRQALPDDSCGECSQCHKIGKLIHPDLHFAFPVSSTSSLTDSEKKAPVSDYFLSSFKELALANPYFTEQDLYEAISLESKSAVISANEARKIFEKLSLKAAEAAYKTIIIYLPEKMNPEASNKLLKLLEEPPQGTLFLLITHASERILQTIRSRCQIIYLQPTGGAVPLNPALRESFDAILQAGIDKRIIDLFPEWENLAGLGREKQKEFCLFAQNYLRKIFMVSCGLEGLAALTSEEEARVRTLARKIKPSFYEKAFIFLEDAISSIESNVNPKLVFCDLCDRLLLSL